MAIRPYNTTILRIRIARNGLWAVFILADLAFADLILTLRYYFYFSDASFPVGILFIAGCGRPFNFEIWRNQSLSLKM